MNEHEAALAMEDRLDVVLPWQWIEPSADERWRTWARRAMTAYWQGKVFAGMLDVPLNERGFGI